MLGGHGTVRTRLDGKPTGAFVLNADRLYTVVSGTAPRNGMLELRVSPGVTAYAFTFG